MELSSDEIHHLKSPLTSLKLGLDLLKRKSNNSNPEELLPLINSLEEKANLLGERLEGFIEKVTKEPPPLG